MDEPLQPKLYLVTKPTPICPSLLIDVTLEFLGATIFMQWWRRQDRAPIHCLLCCVHTKVFVRDFFCVWCSVCTHVGEIPRTERNLTEESSNILLWRMEQYGAERLRISLCISGGASWVEIFKGTGLTKEFLSRGHLDLKTKWWILQGIHKDAAQFHRCPPLRLKLLGGYELLLLLLQLHPPWLQVSDWTRMQAYVPGSSWYARTFLNPSIRISRYSRFWALVSLKRYLHTSLSPDGFLQPRFPRFCNVFYLWVPS